MTVNRLSRSLWQEDGSLEVPEIGGKGAVEPIDFDDVMAELETDEVEIPGMQSKDSLSENSFTFACHCLNMLGNRYEPQCL